MLNFNFNIFIIFFLFTLFAKGQISDSLNIKNKTKPCSYCDFLTDENVKNYVFNGGAKYQVTTYAESFNSNGLYFNLGLNLARFFSKKIILGAFVDFNIKHNFLYKEISSNTFVTDFNNSFNSNYASQEDSAVAYVFKNSLSDRHLSNGSYGKYGFMFSPFPDKYGGILLSFKKGSSSYYCYFYDNKFVADGKQEHIYFDVKIQTWELTIKPLLFFKKMVESDNAVKHLSVSFSYDKVNIKNLTIFNTRLSSMVDEAFMSKYGETKRFTVAFGFTFY